jgi:hypothetical protein
MKTQKTNNLPPELQINKLSKKTLITFFCVSLILTTGGVFGFLYYKESKKEEIKEVSFLPPRVISPAYNLYTNDYWGFKFRYPGDWYPVIGSYEEGKYYFSSENIKFISEQSDNEALVEVQTYNNLKNTTFSEWLKEHEEHFFPRGEILETKTRTINGYKAKEYLLRPARPLHNAHLLHIVAISRNEKKQYIFFLETKDQETHDRFTPLFEQILESVAFYDGFGS